MLGVWCRGLGVWGLRSELSTSGIEVLLWIRITALREPCNRGRGRRGFQGIRLHRDREGLAGRPILSGGHVSQRGRDDVADKGVDVQPGRRGLANSHLSRSRGVYCEGQKVGRDSTIGAAAAKPAYDGYPSIGREDQ